MEHSYTQAHFVAGNGGAGCVWFENLRNEQNSTQGDVDKSREE